MSYDFHEVNRTSINAPLNRENNQNPYTETVAENIDRMLAQGCPREKLIMGIPTYGRTYSLMDANRNGVDAPVDGLGEPGPYTLSDGSLGFNEVKFFATEFAIFFFHVKESFW
jgi:GH18 family chitinase